MAAILSLAGSNSSISINYKLVKHTSSLIEGHEIRLLNMARYPFPMYSEDEEKQGYSNSLVELKNDIQRADAIILSVNEHNGNPSAYFKNVIDWLSRLERKFLLDKKVLLMSTSGGKRGGIGSIGVIESLLPRFGAEIISTFSLPSFHENFNADGIIDDSLKIEHQKALNAFLETLK
ncbi:NADPH-dependent FMN reductase [Flagellimonas sp. CMM7]|uniref:NADPH-dependent FMN reductase n=1 Tax=Flagellimonas sp. CMM7 TaxID=2654676 RepID=UPI0013D839F1|nr:NAD(P)H-dependent oxidoreductase [Flagellimonas sp. CMM7]UII79354.1 NAD(P)H-dependent oxidoreductase [Flagellimonas sp. CMM7]